MRKLLAAAVLTLAVLGVAAPAVAGGWAVTTLDPLAAQPVAGEPFDVGFTIRQHGRTPVSMPDATIVVTDAAGVTTRFPATPDGAVGHHVASVVLPADGAYSWAVEHGLGTQELGPLAVGSTATGGTDGTGTPWTVALLAAAAVLAGLGVADLSRGMLARRRHAALPA